MSDSDEDKSSKTEDPTEQKLRKAREQGDVPSSREPGGLAVTFALFVGMTFLVTSMAPQLAAVMGDLIGSAGTLQVGTFETGVTDMAGIIGGLLGPIVLILAPLFVTMVVAGLAGVLAQGETVVSLERIKPKGKNISPAAGFGRIYSGSAFVEFLKNLAKVAIISGVSVWLAFRAIEGLLPGAEMIPETLPGHVRLQAALFLAIIVCIFTPITLADIAYKRFDWFNRQRMSHKDIKDERKQSEGSPEIKQKRAQIRFARARQQRLREKVPTADMILTNPTHYAVALRYTAGVDPAPVCVAKGTDAMAAQVRAIARTHDIPIIENRPLARALHASVEVDQVIPSEHWEAVAQIVGWVMDLRRKVRRAPPRGSSLRQAD